MKQSLEKLLPYIFEEGKYALMDKLSAPDFYAIREFEEVPDGILGKDNEILGIEQGALQQSVRGIFLASATSMRQPFLFEAITSLSCLFPSKIFVIIFSPTTFRFKEYDSLVGFAPIFDNAVDCACWLKELYEWLDKQSPEIRQRAQSSIDRMSKLTKFLYRNHPNKKDYPFLKDLF